jgi:hypothetical protein
MRQRLILMFLGFLIICAAVVTVEAQQTAFTYQGKLTESGNPANGNYDLTVRLFDTPFLGSGAQQGATLSLTNVPVSAGVFTVQLDFGACPSCFNGGNRFLEIAVKPSGVGAFTTLTPRQQITSTPYAIKSAAADALSLTCVSCVTSSQIQSVEGSKVTGIIDGSQIDGEIPVDTVPAGSENYIQNRTTLQPDSSFNVSGNGIIGGNVGIGTTLPRYKLHVVGQDVRVESDTPNNWPRFSWNFTGALRDEKKWQVYAQPSTLLFSALNDAEDFENPWLLVRRTGRLISGVEFPGPQVSVNKLGIGMNSPQFALHVTGDFFSNPPNIRVEGPTLGTPAFPRFSLNHVRAPVDEKKWQNYAGNEGLVFSGLNDAENTESTWLRVTRSGASIGSVLFPNGNVGIDTVVPQAKLHITDTNSTLSRPTLRVQTNAGGLMASFGGSGEFQIDAPGRPGGRFAVKENGDVYIGTGKFSSNTIGDIFIGSHSEATGQLTVRPNGRVGIGWAEPSGKLDVNGDIRFSAPGSAGSTHLCLNGLSQISFCSSSLRYKTDLHPFTSGLNLINRLHPITFKWKADQTLDLGLGAEDVAAVEPMLVTYNKKGEIEGVKYDRLSAVFINAFKEQQAQIKSQEEKLKSQEVKIKSQSDDLAALQMGLASLERSIRPSRHHSRAGKKSQNRMR